MDEKRLHEAVLRAVAWVELEPTTTYPDHRVVDVTLRDGSTIHVRPVLPEDINEVVGLFHRLSDESVRSRFHGQRRPTIDDLREFVEVDYATTFGLIAETSQGGKYRVVALASYVPVEPSRAEVAIVVDDAFHGKGLGSILLEHLVEAAQEAGITSLVADVMSSNQEMLEVLRALQLPLARRSSGDAVHFEFHTSLTTEAVGAFEQREATAATSGIAAFLKPTSVAVIGASRRRGTIGGEIFHNLLEAGFEGAVFPVNPTSDVVQSVPAYPTVLDVPASVDLAVVVVPAALVRRVVGECGQKGVRALLIISAGFAEVGPEGRVLQDEIVQLAREYGMRIVGPNCMGVLNTAEDVHLNATFAHVSPARGNLGFSSQSGALGIAVVDLANKLGLGMSSFVSVGNKADISGNDLIQFWEQDPDTSVILLYLESFGNPRKFARIARRVARSKPIVAVKSGRSVAGARAASSHTASVAAGDVAVDALFRQTGVIRSDTLEELFDVASLLAHQPLPSGTRVAILTNAGGLGILCADACEAAGLEVPHLSPGAREELASFLAAEASVGNPVDMIASASAEQFGRALEILGRTDDIDSIIVIFIPPLVTRAEDVAAAVRDAARTVEKTLLSCFLGVQGIHRLLETESTAIPSFSFPESAARALGAVTSYATWRGSPEGTFPALDDIRRSDALALVAKYLRDEPAWLDPAAVEDLLSCYGVRLARGRAVASEEEVETAAGEMELPVAVKLMSRSIVHKSDVGGVRLGLATPADARHAAEQIRRELQARNLDTGLDGFLVQEMIQGTGAEMFVGVTHDPSFGPLLACGAGGTLVELLRDVAVRITPLTDIDAKEMITSLKTYPLLEGYRGQPALDEDALRDLILRISALVEDIPHLMELDLNPVLVLERGQGCVVLDARMKVGIPPPLLSRGARTPPATG
ncbi:MAG: GNAT family N-acetyltransferase [Actinobacteria bacterium]|nr:GNAT family N-acetyltransferase [Actinomycetota bacterium]